MAQQYEVSKTWWRGNYNEFKQGQRFFVGWCGTGRSVFGERATLVQITDKHLIFKTDSGTKIMTAAWNLYIVSGKAGKQGIFVSPVFTGIDRHYYHAPVFIY